MKIEPIEQIFERIWISIINSDFDFVDLKDIADIQKLLWFYFEFDGQLGADLWMAPPDKTYLKAKQN